MTDRQMAILGLWISIGGLVLTWWLDKRLHEKIDEALATARALPPPSANQSAQQIGAPGRSIAANFFGASAG